MPNNDNQKPSQGYGSIATPDSGTPLWANATSTKLVNESPIVGGTTYQLDVDKYLPYIQDVRPYVGVEKLDVMRARAQTNGEKFLHFLNQAVTGEIIGGSIRGIGTIFELPDAIISELTGGSADFNNSIMQLGDSIAQATKSGTPIYRQNPNKTWDTGDAGWWFENAVSITSALGMLVPALGVTRVGGGLLKGLGLTGRLSREATELGKALTTAVVMRNAENMAESSAIVKDGRIRAMEQFSDDAKFDEWLLSNEGQRYLSEGNAPDKSAAADYIASGAGWRSYAINSANIVFDFVQASAFLKSNYFTRTNTVKSAAIQNKLYGAPATIFESVGRNITPFTRTAASILGEGVEEGVNFIGEQEGRKYIDSILEHGKRPGLIKSISDNMNAYLNDEHMWEQTVWGTVGGAVFEGAGLISQKLASNDGKGNDQLKLAEIGSREAALKAHAAQISAIAQKVASGQIEEQTAREAVKVVNDGLAYSIGLAAAKAGNVDLVLDSFNSGEVEKSLTEGATTDFQKEIVSKKEIANLKAKILRVEEAYREAASFYFNKEVTDASKSALIDKYAEHSYNIKSRKIDEANAELVFAEKSVSDLNYQANLVQGSNPKLDLQVRVLKEMVATTNLAPYKTFIENEIKELEKQRTSPDTLGTVDNSLKDALKVGLLHKFSRVASENAIAELRSTKNIKGFDKALTKAIEDSQKEVEDKEFVKFANKVQTELDAIPVEERVSRISGILAGTDAVYKNLSKRERDHLSKLLANYNKQVKTNNAKTSATTAQVIDDKTTSGTIGADAEVTTRTPQEVLGLTKSEYQKIVNNINKAITNIDEQQLKFWKKRLNDILTQFDLDVNDPSEKGVIDLFTDFIDKIDKAIESASAKKEAREARNKLIADTTEEVVKVDNNALQAALDNGMMVHDLATMFNFDIDDFIGINDYIVKVQTSTSGTQSARINLISKTIEISKELLFDEKKRSKLLEVLNHEYVHHLVDAVLKQIPKEDRPYFLDDLSTLIGEITFPDTIKGTEAYFIFQKVVTGSPIELITYALTNDSFYDMLAKHNSAVLTKLQNILTSPILKSRLENRRHNFVERWTESLPAHTFEAEQLAQAYGVQVGNIQGTGENGRVTITDVQNFIKSKNIRPLKDVDIQYNDTGDYNVYVPFLTLGITPDGVVSADQYNAKVVELYKDQAIKLTQEQLEESIKRLLSYDFGPNTKIRATKWNNLIVFETEDGVLVGFLNNAVVLGKLYDDVVKLSRATSLEEVEALELTKAAEPYRQWRGREFIDDQTNDKPFATAVTQVQQQVSTVLAIKRQVEDGNSRVIVTRKTSGTFVKSEFQPLINIAPALDEVWFVPPGQSNQTLKSSKDGRRYVRIADTQYFNIDNVYTEGLLYAFFPNALSVPGNENTMTPIPLKVSNVGKAVAQDVTKLIMDIIDLVANGADPLTNEDVRDKIIELTAFVNVEPAKYSSEDYVNITSDEIRMSFVNPKRSGEVNHLHIAYASKFDGKPTAYITVEKGKDSKKIPFKIQGKELTYLSGVKEISELLPKVVINKRHNVNYKLLSNTERKILGMSYFDYLKRNVLQTDISILRSPDGTPLTDERGNRVPNVFGKTQATKSSNFILSVKAVNRDNELEQPTLFRKVDKSVSPVQEDIAAMQTWWQETFGGNIPFEVELAKVITRGEVEAWGVFEDGAVAIASGAVQGTAYHEAFHVVFNMYLSPDERTALLNESNGDSDLAKEEWLADRFMEYMLNRRNKPTNNLILQFFERLYKFLKSLFTGKQDSLRDRVFKDIASSGKFNTQPKYSFSGKRYKLIDGFTAQEQAEVIGVMTKALIDFMELNPTMTISELKQSGSLKVTMLEYLEGARGLVQLNEREENLDRVIQSFDKFLVETVNHLQRQFGIDVSDAIDSDKELTKAWDDTTIFKTSEKEGLLLAVKRVIMTTPSNESGKFLGLPTYLDFNKYFPYIRRMMAGATTVEEMIQRLDNITQFDSSIGNIANRLRANKILANAWFSQFSKQNPNKSVVLFNQDSIEIDIANKRSGHYILSDEWTDNFKLHLESGDLLPKLDSIKERKNQILEAVKTGNHKDIADRLNEFLSIIGTNISSETIQKFFQNPMYGGMKKVMFDVVEPLMNAVISDIGNERIDSYGRFNSLAELAIQYHIDLTESSSFNVNGESEFGFINPNYLSDFVAKFAVVLDRKTVDKAAAKRALFNILFDYAKDPAMRYSNWLFGPNGFFSVNEGQSVNDLTEANLNLSNVAKFGYTLLDGMKHTILREGVKYGDMTDGTWLFCKVAMYMSSVDGRAKDSTFMSPILIPSDSGNIYFVQSGRIRGAGVDGKIQRFIDGKANPLWVAVKNTVNQEIERMIAARQLLFKEVNGVFVPKEHKLNVDNNDENYVDYTKLQKFYHYVSVDSNGLPIIMQDGKPTGRVFAFNNIRTLNKIKVSWSGYDYDLLENGIYQADTYNNEELLALIENTIDENVDAFINELVSDGINTLKNYEEQFSSIERSNRYSTYAQFVAEYYVNNYINNVEQFNFFVGQQSEYKNDKDTNKRAKEIVSPKLKLARNKVGFVGVSMSDVHVQGLMYESIVKSVAKSLGDQSYDMDRIKAGTPATAFEAKLLSIVGGYKKINSTDAQGYVTLERYEEILEGLGRLTDRMKSLIKKMKDVRYKPNPKELREVLQPLKGFYYGRDYDAYLNKHVSSQIKYSSMPLIPALVYGTEAEKLYKWATREGIDEMFFESAEKVGSTHIINIFKDGKIDQDILDKYSKSNGYQHRLYYNDNWGLQLDVPDHIQDTVNKLSTQLAKIIFANIESNGDYQVGNTTMKGSELIKLGFDLMSANIEEDFNNLLVDIGAELIDGKYVVKDKTNLSAFLKKEAERRSLNSNYSSAVEIVDLGDGTVDFYIPLYASALSTKWESVLASVFSNNVTDQKIAGGSAVVTSSAFLTDTFKPKGVISGDEQTLIDLENEANKSFGINWLDRKRTDKNLKMLTFTDENGNKVVKAEILLPAWSKEFYQNGTLIDINNVPEEIRTGYWYRIPYEGKHSGLICEVVGFIPTDTNMIVLPPEAINQSGEDMDVDKRFGIVPVFNYQNGAFVKHEMHSDESFDRWVNTQMAKRIKANLIANPSEELKNISTQIKRFKTILANAKAGMSNLRNFKNSTKEQVVENILSTINDVFGSEVTSLREASVLLNESTRTVYSNLDAISELYNTRWLESELDREMQELQDGLLEDRDTINALKDTISQAYQTFVDLREDVSEASLSVKQKEAVVQKYINAKQQELLSQLREEYNKLPDVARSTKTERNNKLLDIIQAIYNNPVHYAEIMSPSGFVEGAAVIKQVDALTNADKIELNPTLGKTQDYFRKQNISGRTLKGMAADSNAFLTVAQVAKMELRPDLGIWMKYNGVESVATLKEKYDDVVETTDGVYVKHTRFAWNKDGTFTNATGDVTTKHAAQTLAQILDIVKEGIPYNMNTYTFYIMAAMLSTGVPMNEVGLYIRQPIINDITNEFFNNQELFTDNTGREISKVKLDYMNKLVLVRAKLGRYKGKSSALKYIERANANKFYIGKKDGELVDVVKDLFNITLANPDNTNGVYSASEMAEMIGQESKFRLDTPIEKMTSEELVSFETFLKKQIQIGERFLKYKEAGEAWQDIINAIPVDRKGIGPSLASYNVLREKIINATSYGTEGARVLIDGDAATLKVYGEVPNIDTQVDSVYPVMASYNKYGYQLAYDILSPLFLKYTVGVDSVVRDTMNKLGVKYNEELANTIANYYVFTQVTKLPFFNETSLEQLYGIGQTPTFDESVFDDLSAANQLLILKQKYADNLANSTNILNYLEHKLSKQDVERRGGHTIEFINTLSDDITDDEIIRSFQDLWNGFVGNTYDPQLSTFARSLVRYSFFYSGFGMKSSSISKLIPNAVLHEIGYVEHLRNLEMLNKAPNVGIGEFFDNFVRSNSFNSTIIPIFQPKKEGVYNIDKATEILTISEKALEFMPRIMTSEYIKVPIFVTTKEGNTTKTVKVDERLYRYSLNTGDVRRYVPVSTLGNKFITEVGTTVIDKNKTTLPEELYEEYALGSKPTNALGVEFAGQHQNPKDALMFSTATQFIGSDLMGVRGSTTDLFKTLFRKLANSGQYNADDLVMVSVQGKRGNIKSSDLKSKIIVDDKFTGVYSNITRAIMAGATVMIASPYTENGTPIKSYNKDYNIGDMIVRNHLIRQVNDGKLALRIENGVQFFALSESNIQTFSRKRQQLNKDESDAVDNNTSCNV